MNPETTNSSVWKWVVTIVVIVALVIIGIVVFGGGKNAEPVTETNNDQKVEQENITSDKVVVVDQFPGNVVYVSSVSLSKPGFVVIKKDAQGVPGEVIGTQYFEAGINPGKVTLSQPTVNGKTYYAVLYSDNGDKKFDMTKDMEVKDARQNTVMRPFRTTSDANVEIKG
jgi:hypothetical protein